MQVQGTAAWRGAVDRVAADRPARGGAVDPVRGLGAAGQAEPERVEMVGQRLAAAWARMDRQARRLVDDEQQGIAVEEARAYVEGVGHPDRLEGRRRVGKVG